MKLIFNAAGIVSYMSARKHNHSQVILNGKYKGYYYNIVDCHSHPTAYVGVDSTSIYYEMDYDSIYGMTNLEVHGGLTFSDYSSYFIPKDLNLWWFGWDYAHLGDHYAYDMPLPSDRTGKKWTLFEILSHVLGVIDQLCD